MASITTASSAAACRPAVADDESDDVRPARHVASRRHRSPPRRPSWQVSAPDADASVVARATPVGVASSPASGAGAATSRPRISSSTAGAGTGSTPCAVRTDPEPSATGDEHDPDGAQRGDARARRHDVGDRVERADLVEVHLLHRRPRAPGPRQQRAVRRSAAPARGRGRRAATPRAAAGPPPTAATVPSSRGLDVDLDGPQTRPASPGARSIESTRAPRRPPPPAGRAAGRRGRPGPPSSMSPAIPAEASIQSVRVTRPSHRTARPG